MSLRQAAVAAQFAAVCLAGTLTHAAALETLTLDDAFARVANNHPQLRLVEARQAVLAAERDRAALRPPLVAGVEAENILGTGNLSGVDGAELTLTLASMLEQRAKPAARRALAQSRIDSLTADRDARQLDLLADVARRYLIASAALHVQRIGALDIAQRQRAVDAARERLRAGAAPEAMVFMAEAALARAQLDYARSQQQWLAARQHLAALWSERTPAFDIAAGEPLSLPDLPPASALADLLQGGGELARFSGARRVAEARVQLARSAARADVQWQVGVRGVNAGDDVALIAGVQIPLGAARQAEPEQRAARLELAALEVERTGTESALYATLVEAHGRYGVAQLEVAALREQVLPALLRAEAAAERAWRAGASSYLEWSQIQSEVTATRRRQLDVAIDAHIALIEMQRLTGQAIVTRLAAGETP